MSADEFCGDRHRTPARRRRRIVPPPRLIQARRVRHRAPAVGPDQSLADRRRRGCRRLGGRNGRRRRRCTRPAGAAPPYLAGELERVAGDVGELDDLVALVVWPRTNARSPSEIAGATEHDRPDRDRRRSGSHRGSRPPLAGRVRPRPSRSSGQRGGARRRGHGHDVAFMVPWPTGMLSPAPSRWTASAAACLDFLATSAWTQRTE